MTKEEQLASGERDTDRNEIIRLHRIVSPTGGDMDSIYRLYKKYVDPTARQYNTNGCQTCGNSIVNYWRKLCEWWRYNSF